MQCLLALQCMFFSLLSAPTRSEDQGVNPRQLNLQIVSNYTDCYVLNPSLIGDGRCDNFLPYNTDICGNDGGDCSSFNERFPGCEAPITELVGDGICQNVYPYNSEKCKYDGGDCEEFRSIYPECYIMETSWIGNGECQDFRPYNSKECGFDGGDCPQSKKRKDQSIQDIIASNGAVFLCVVCVALSTWFRRRTPEITANFLPSMKPGIKDSIAGSKKCKFEPRDKNIDVIDLSGERQYEEEEVDIEMPFANDEENNTSSMIDSWIEVSAEYQDPTSDIDDFGNGEALDSNYQRNESNDGLQEIENDVTDVMRMNTAQVGENRKTAVEAFGYNHLSYVGRNYAVEERKFEKVLPSENDKIVESKKSDDIDRKRDDSCPDEPDISAHESTNEKSRDKIEVLDAAGGAKLEQKSNSSGIQEPVLASGIKIDNGAGSRGQMIVPKEVNAPSVGAPTEIDKGMNDDKSVYDLMINSWVEMNAALKEMSSEVSDIGTIDEADVQEVNTQSDQWSDSLIGDIDVNYENPTIREIIEATESNKVDVSDDFMKSAVKQGAENDPRSLTFQYLSQMIARNKDRLSKSRNDVSSSDLNVKEENEGIEPAAKGETACGGTEELDTFLGEKLLDNVVDQKLMGIDDNNIEIESLSDKASEEKGTTQAQEETNSGLEPDANLDMMPHGIAEKKPVGELCGRTSGVDYEDVSNQIEEKIQANDDARNKFNNDAYDISGDKPLVVKENKSIGPGSVKALPDTDLSSKNHKEVKLESDEGEGCGGEALLKSREKENDLSTKHEEDIDAMLVGIEERFFGMKKQESNDSGAIHASRDKVEKNRDGKDDDDVDKMLIDIEERFFGRQKQESHEVGTEMSSNEKSIDASDVNASNAAEIAGTHNENQAQKIGVKVESKIEELVSCDGSIDKSNSDDDEIRLASHIHIKVEEPLEEKRKVRFKLEDKISASQKSKPTDTTHDSSQNEIDIAEALKIETDVDDREKLSSPIVASRSVLPSSDSEGGSRDLSQHSDESPSSVMLSRLIHKNKELLRMVKDRRPKSDEERFGEEPLEQEKEETGHANHGAENDGVIDQGHEDTLIKRYEEVIQFAKSEDEDSEIMDLPKRVTDVNLTYASGSKKKTSQGLMARMIDKNKERLRLMKKRMSSSIVMDKERLDDKKIAGEEESSAESLDKEIININSAALMSDETTTSGNQESEDDKETNTSTSDQRESNDRSEKDVSNLKENDREENTIFVKESEGGRLVGMSQADLNEMKDKNTPYDDIPNIENQGSDDEHEPDGDMNREDLRSLESNTDSTEGRTRISAISEEETFASDSTRATSNINFTQVDENSSYKLLSSLIERNKKRLHMLQESRKAFHTSLEERSDSYIDTERIPRVGETDYTNISPILQDGEESNNESASSSSQSNHKSQSSSDSSYFDDFEY